MNALVGLPMIAALDTYTPITPSDYDAVLTAVNQQVSVSTVVGVIAAAITGCIALVFMWWGARKAVRMLMSAWKKGKLRI